MALEGAYAARAMPDHLRVRVEVVDASGKSIAAGRDLATLRTQLGGQQRTASREAAKGETGPAGAWAEAETACAAVSDNGTSQLRTVALRTPLVTCWPAKASIATKSGNLVTADAEPGDLSDARAAALAGAMGGQPDSEYRLVFLERVGPMGSERADAAA